MRISTFYPLVIAGLTLVSATAAGVVAYQVAASELVRQALPAFQRAYRALGDEAGPRLRKLYVDRSPLPVGERDALNDARDDSDWSAAHRRFHPWLRRGQDAH